MVARLAGRVFFAAVALSLSVLGAAVVDGVQDMRVVVPVVLADEDVQPPSWECLLADGWRGRAEDGMEALYPMVGSLRACGVAARPDDVLVVL